MPKARKKKNMRPRAGAAPVPETRGRPPTNPHTMTTSIFIRLTDEQKDALKEYIADVNAERAGDGLPRIDLSTWIRELALKHSGNSHLGSAAQALAAAKAAAAIV